MDRSSPTKVRQVKEVKAIELSTRIAEAAEAQLERFIESRHNSEVERLERLLGINDSEAREKGNAA